ncbi:MAG: LytTR family transcriptional regulator [Clostridia bacterium]|nr:LytTR family transcriptional regulator [Clostridia bacterium]
MKIRIETDANITESEVIIRCNTVNEEIKQIEKALVGASQKVCIPFFKDSTEYFIPLDEVLFFESDNGGVFAHTSKDMYKVKSSLAGLGEILPAYFVRASKSAIINVDRVCSVEKSLTSFSTVGFFGTHKKIYASRSHIKGVMQAIKERKTVL